MGKSSAAPLDYAALMRDIRAQGLKHALEKQPARNGGMVAKTLPATYGQMHEGKGLKKVVTSRGADDDTDEPQQPRSAPHPFKRESSPDDAELFARLAASGVLTSPPRHRVPSPSKNMTPRQPLKEADQRGAMQGSSGRSNGGGIVEEDESQARGGFAAARMPPPSKPPRLPSGSSSRQGQSPQKRIGDGNAVAGEEGGILEKENSKRARLEAPASKAAKPLFQQNQTGGMAKPPSGGEGGDSSRGGPRLRAEGLMAPPAADAATLRRQVAALQVELEAHIEGEGKLQSLNTQLRERLAAYQSQNRESTALANEELATLQKDLDRTLEEHTKLAEKAGSLEREKHYIEAALQKRVAEFEAERTVLRARIEDMSEDVRVKAEATAQAELLKVELDSVLAVRDNLENEVERLAAESQYVKQKAEEYSTELRALLEKEQHEELLHRRWRAALQRRMFAHFRSAVATQKRRQRHKRAAAYFAARRTLGVGFRSWVLATKRSRKMNSILSRRRSAYLREVFRLWRLEVSVGARQRSILAAQRREILTRGVATWRARVAAARAARARGVTAERFQMSRVCRRVLRAWRREVGKGRLSLQEEEALGLGADLHYETAVRRRALWAWVDWVDDVARPRAARISRANAQNRRSLLRRAFRAWEDGVDAKVLKSERKATAVKMANRSLTQRGFEAWFEYRQHKVETRGRQALAERCFLDHQFRRWHDALLEIRAEREARKKGNRLRAVVLTRVCMKAWVNVVARKKRARAANTRAFAHYLSALRAAAWAAWRQGLEVSRAEKRAVRDGQRALLRSFLARWKDYHRQCLVKSVLEKRASAHARRREKRALRCALEEWWEVCVVKRQRRRVEQLLRERRERGIARRFFVAWRMSVYEGLRDVHLTVHNEYVESQAKCEEQAARISAVDLENLQLIDRLHALSTEFAQLQSVIKEQRDKNEDLQRSLEDGAVLESSLRADADHARSRARALQDEIAALQRALAGRNEEDTAAEVRHQLEVQGLSKELEGLRSEVEEKGAQLEACEQALQEASERLDAAAANSQEKLTNALEIAASLRQMLDEKDRHVAALEAERQAGELDLGEMQRKVAAANQTLRDAVDAREIRIRELEAQARQYQQEAQKHQIETQELRIAVERRSAQVRKLEYEVRLLREREQSKADAFISALHARARSPPPARARESVHRSPEPSQHAPDAQAAPTTANGFVGFAAEQNGRPGNGIAFTGMPGSARQAGSTVGETDERGARARSPNHSPERGPVQSSGPPFVTPEKRTVHASYPIASGPRQPGAAGGVASPTPEKRQVPAVSAQAGAYRSPAFVRRASPERDPSRDRGLSSQRPIHTGQPTEQRATSPELRVRSALSDGEPDTSPVHRNWATARQENGASRSPEPRTRQALASGAQHAGFAQWTPQAARREISPKRTFTQPILRRSQEAEGRSKDGIAQFFKGPASEVGLEAGLGGERRGSGSHSDSDDSAKDLHAEIQKLQARIMDRLKESPERSEPIGSSDDIYR